MDIKIVDAFIPAHTRQAIETIVRSLPSTFRIGINLTGGTKLMFAGGLSACNEFPNVEPFYFDIKQNNITFIRTEVNIPFKGVKTIDGFFTASGYNIAKRGYWGDMRVREDRKELTLALWENRDLLGQLYQNKEFRAYKIPYGKPCPPFHFSGKSYNATLEGNRASLTLNGVSLKVPNCTDFAIYLGGGWLEEYAFLHFLPLVQSGTIFDLRIGVEVDPVGQLRQQGQMPVGEFDCVYTDGNRLWIVECKAGAVKQEHLQKLENNVKTYGGIAAKGILFTAFPLIEQHKKRIASSTSIQVISPE